MLFQNRVATFYEKYKSLIPLILLCLVFISVPSHAQLSETFGKSTAKESGFFLKWGAYIAGILGFASFIFGIIEYRAAKDDKARGDKSKAIWYMLAGVALGSGTFWYVESQKSFTGETNIKLETDFKG